MSSIVVKERDECQQPQYRNRLFAAKQSSGWRYRADSSSAAPTTRMSLPTEMVSQPKCLEDIPGFMAPVLDLMGETPLIEITKFDCGSCRLFLMPVDPKLQKQPV
jgi:hypothetical protein